MASRETRVERNSRGAIATGLGWALLVLLILPVLRESVAIRFLVPGRLGPTFWNLQFFYYAHGLLALAAVLLGSLQFG